MSYAQQLADRYNATMKRKDIEWAVGANDQLYLRDKESFTKAHTEILARTAEDERQRMQTRRTYPVQEAAE